MLDPATASNTLATLASLLSDFLSHREAAEGKNFDDFVSWLSDQRHDEIRGLLESNSRTVIGLKALLGEHRVEVRESLVSVKNSLAFIVENMARAAVTTNPAPLYSPGELVSSDRLTSVVYADLNNDGKDELIVQFPIAAHGTAIQIYQVGFQGMELITEWSCDTPFGFEVDTSESDKPLLRAVETNASSGLPYVMGLRDVVWYRLTDNKLVEQRRLEPSAEEIAEARR